MSLTDNDRERLAELVDCARKLGPELRTSTIASDRARLAGWLLTDLADLAEKLAGDDEHQAVTKS